MFTEGALRPWEAMMRDPIGRTQKAQNLQWRTSGRASTLKINGAEVERERKPHAIQNKRSARVAAPAARTFDRSVMLEISRGIRANLSI
jgi:hypothetical protein